MHPVAAVQEPDADLVVKTVPTEARNPRLMAGVHLEPPVPHAGRAAQAGRERRVDRQTGGPSAQ
eukprot:3670241-Alexandrium_andersonii.AAC.1